MTKYFKLIFVANLQILGVLLISFVSAMSLWGVLSQFVSYRLATILSLLLGVIISVVWIIPFWWRKLGELADRVDSPDNPPQSGGGSTLDEESKIEVKPRSVVKNDLNMMKIPSRPHESRFASNFHTTKNNALKYLVANLVIVQLSCGVCIVS